MVNYQPESGMTSAQLTSDELSGGTGIDVVEIIETVIGSLDQSDSAMVSQSDGGHIWKFKYGSVEVFVQLTGMSEEDSLSVWSSVLKLPAKREPELFKKLLEMNWMTTFEAGFAIYDNQVVVLSTRTIAELSPGEISRLITVVASVADDNDEALVAEFSEG